MNINSNIILVTFSILYVNVIWNQRQHPTICCGATYFKQNKPLFNDIKEIDGHIITDHKIDLDQILLYGYGRCRYDTNRMILLSTIKFCIDSRRFDSAFILVCFLCKIKTAPLKKSCCFSFSF